MVLDDTICASASVAGTGAIATVRVSGPDALRISSSVVRLRKGSLCDARGYSVHMAEILNGDGTSLDQALVTVFRSPHSYTGEDSVEIGCHSSTYIVNTLLSLLVDAGARIAEAGEFTRRAFLNGKMDLAQAEAVADVIAAESEAQHRVAFSQLKGGYSSELKALRDRLVELSALMELELDFSEEDVEFADRRKLSSLLDLCLEKTGMLADSFRDGNAIRNGVPVAIAGAPNSGKSTLLNALLGDERAIVSDIPGTTRDTVEESLFLGGVKVRFIDTAGIRESSDPVEKMGMERSLEAVGKARVVIVLLDPLSPDESLSVLMNVRDRVEDWQKVLVVRSKKDLEAEGGDGRGFDVGTDGWREDGELLSISARTGAGLDELKRRIASLCPVASGQPTVTNARHYQALRRAWDSLRAVRDGLGIPDDARMNGSVPPLDEAGLNRREPSRDDARLDRSVPPLDDTLLNGRVTVPTELLCEDLRSAISELNSIFGEQIATDEVLGEIFGRFCIGK